MLKCREGGRMSELRLFFLKYQPFLLYPPIQNQMLIWRSAAQGPNPFLKSLFSASFKSGKAGGSAPIVHPILLYILFSSISYFCTSYFQYILFLVLPIFEVPFLHMWLLISVYPILVHLIFGSSYPKYEVPNVGLSYVRCFLLLCSYLYVFLSVCYS